MPKTRVAVRPDDVPIWDALVAELGDPRPYEPTAIGTVVVTGEPCVDDGGFDDAYSVLDDVVEDVECWLAARESEARATVDDLVIEFCARHGIPCNLPEVVQPITGPVGELTVMVPALGTLDQLRNPIDELPSW
jgi:hypothetical protein